jgi:hypothetical protein
MLSAEECDKLAVEFDTRANSSVDRQNSQMLSQIADIYRDRARESRAAKTLQKTQP